jgi:hypothetical protein
MEDKNIVKMYGSTNFILDVLNIDFPKILNEKSLNKPAKLLAQKFLDHKDEIIKILNTLDLT